MVWVMDLSIIPYYCAPKLCVDATGVVIVTFSDKALVVYYSVSLLLLLLL